MTLLLAWTVIMGTPRPLEEPAPHAAAAAVDTREEMSWLEPAGHSVGGAAAGVAVFVGLTLWAGLMGAGAVMGAAALRGQALRWDAAAFMGVALAVSMVLPLATLGGISADALVWLSLAKMKLMAGVPLAVVAQLLAGSVVLPLLVVALATGVLALVWRRSNPSVDPEGALQWATLGAAAGALVVLPLCVMSATLMKAAMFWAQWSRGGG